MISSCICSGKSNFDIKINYNNSIFIEYKGVIIGKCKKCGILKTITTSNNFNPKTSFSTFYEDRKEKFRKLFFPIAQNLMLFKKSGDVLDVGCSSGILMEILNKKGFNVWGIEPNSQAHTAAKKKFGDKIFYGILENFLEYNKKQFDVVIYNHVLEHIDDINKEFRLIKRTLKKNGILIIGLPNTSSVIFYLRQMFWELLRPNEHVWHFSEKYLTKYLNNNNYEILNMIFYNDDRKDYPYIKRIYFKILSSINRILNTGEAMLTLAKRVN
ncbi:MAG: class I SAM-dependent methyltransferase [Candidatus Levybacteria bacterium]|nr:class I SAM-dependent methyltransferase [Candidatus Levybacteria bacterium]